MSRSKDQVILQILNDLTESIRSIQSMALGGEYEDTRLWSVEHDLLVLKGLVDD